MADIVNCEYSLLDEGRKYSGNHRNYLIKNARDICYSPATREAIRLREAYGYFGHGYRMLTNKLRPEEVELIKDKDNAPLLAHVIPTNITVSFDIDKEGKITHSQELITTHKDGQIVKALHEAKIGGFSWACGPADDNLKDGKTTKMGDFAGFDYVKYPGFAYNRGYLLESCSTRCIEDAILECVASVVGNDKAAETIVAQWTQDSTSARLAALENALYLADKRYLAAQEELTAEKAAREAQAKKAGNEIVESVSAKVNAETEAAALRERMASALDQLQDRLPFFVPEAAMHELMEGDFGKARAIFERAAHVDLSQYPIPYNIARPQAEVPNHAKSKDKSVYGTTSYGFDINL